MPDIKNYVKTIVNKRLKQQVDNETWIACIKSLIGVGFSDLEENAFNEYIGQAQNEIKGGSPLDPLKK